MQDWHVHDFVSHDRLADFYNAADIGVWPGKLGITIIEAVFPIGYEFKKQSKQKRKIDLDRILYFNQYGNKKIKNPKKLEV